MSIKPDDTFDIAVVGGGLTGLTAALTMAKPGGSSVRIALVSPPVQTMDGRTTALLGNSISHFERLGVWQECRENAAPLATMRIIDGTSRLWRAPPVDFKAAELGLDAFGYNIANHTLADALNRHIAAENCITRIEERIVSADIATDQLTLHTENDKSIKAKLVIAADGKKSGMREIAGISAREWQYPQTAIAVDLAHSLPHHFTSTEFHTETGPFTVVPLPSTSKKYQSGLVWVLTPIEAEKLLETEQQSLELLIEQKMQSMLGKISLAGAPQKFPLTGMIANKLAANRVALVGDAAHVLPPIGAQGFNMGLRDVVEICTIAATILSTNEDPGSEQVLARYNRARRTDTTARTGAVDLLNRSLLTDFLPVQAIRGIGLFALANIPAIRKQLMKRGLAQNLSQPST